MKHVEIIPTPPDSPADRPAAVSARTLNVDLIDGGQAIFRVPSVGDIKAIEQTSPGLSLSDTCRALSARCLVEWAESTELPPDDEMDAADDQAIVRAFLRELSGALDLDATNDAAIMARYLGQTEAATPSYTVTSDRHHLIRLSAGDLTLRRLTRKDVRRVEAAAEKSGAVTGDVLAATSLCVDWWQQHVRPIMPADFDPIPLNEFRRVSDALKGFLTRNPHSHR